MEQESSPDLQIFLSAIEKQTDNELSAYLDEVCKGDAQLREQVEAMVAAHKRD